MASILDYWRALKGWRKIKQEGKELMEQKQKSGWKSSEFWLGAAGIVGMAYSAFGAFIPPAYAAIGITVISTAYMAGRVIVKATASKADDAFMDALAEKLKGVIKAEPQDPPKQP